MVTLPCCSDPPQSHSHLSLSLSLSRRWFKFSITHTKKAREERYLSLSLSLNSEMEKSIKTFTLLQTVAAAGVFSAVSFWYGFMFGRESARKELGHLIEDLRRGNADTEDMAQNP